MRSRFFILILALLFSITIFIAVSSAEESSSNLDNVKITMASDVAPDPENHQHAAALAFKEYVEEESDGKIKVDIKSGGALGDLESMMEQTISGTIEASIGHTEGNLSIVYPDMQVISIPYLFRSVDHALEVFEGPFGEKLHEEFRKKSGARIIAFWDNGGFRNFTNSERPIHEPEDLKGLKIRTMQIPAHMELVKALGATPTPVSFSELYSALDQGVVDGQENSIPTCLLISLQEVQDYMILDGHLFSMMYLTVNDQWFQDLPAEYQEIITEGGNQASKIGARRCRIVRETGKTVMREAGMEIYDPTPEELEMFKELTQDKVTEFIQEELSNPALVDEIIEEAEKASKELGYQ